MTKISWIKKEESLKKQVKSLTDQPLSMLDLKHKLDDIQNKAKIDNNQWYKVLDKKLIINEPVLKASTRENLNDCHCEIVQKSAIIVLDIDEIVNHKSKNKFNEPICYKKWLIESKTKYWELLKKTFDKIYNRSNLINKLTVKLSNKITRNKLKQRMINSKREIFRSLSKPILLLQKINNMYKFNRPIKGVEKAC